ncbi:MAG: glycosyltransferase family 39 protein [Flavobacteriales bacterium]|nr:glycosyltransferase family 39 protein [Flavobacteriales bacterium]
MLILLVAAALRIYGFADFSLSNDELSALARLNFDSFYDLIMEGVRIDGHPPAAQVILWYMTRIFGDSVFVVRLPFVLAGILAVYFVFRMSRQWLNTSAALIISALFSTLSFPILYSRLARPYALGMLFVAMAGFFWIRIVRNREKPTDFIWLAISLALCGFSHYFAALNGAILAIAGLFLVRRSSLKHYVFALMGGFVLFLPYFSIFLYQLNAGGVGQWLGPPENDWLWKHIDYAFNNSLLVLVAVLIVSIGGFAIHKTKKTFVGHGLPFVLFLLPFLIGFFYSKWVNPVLQNSTLLFSFPFLLVFLLSGWDVINKRLIYTASALLVAIAGYSTVIQNRFYDTDHFGVFKELAEHIVDWNDRVEHDALLIGDFNAPFYIHFYLDELDTVELDLYRTTDEDGLKNLKELIKDSDHDYCFYAWSTVNQAPEVEEMIREKYWQEIERAPYFNSEFVVFKRFERPEAYAEFEFEKNDSWNLNPDKIRLDSIQGDRILIDGESPYGPTYQMGLDEKLVNSETELITRIEFEGVGPETEVQLVYEQVNEEGGYVWESDPVSRQLISDSLDWAIFHYQLKPNENPGDLKMYLWSPKGEEFYLREMKIWIR